MPTCSPFWNNNQNRYSPTVTGLAGKNKKTVFPCVPELFPISNLPQTHALTGLQAYCQHLCPPVPAFFTQPKNAFYSGGPKVNKPPAITEQQNTSSNQHRVNCLAWWLTTKKNETGLAEYLKKQKPGALRALQQPLAHCKAWQWLQTKTPESIRRELWTLEAQEKELLRTELNTLRQKVRPPNG